jgi:hypothetical protein
MNDKAEVPPSNSCFEPGTETDSDEPSFANSLEQDETTPLTSFNSAEDYSDGSLNSTDPMPTMDFLPTHYPTTDTAEHAATDSGAEDLARVAEVSREAPDSVREHAREFVCSTVENLVWYAAKFVALHFPPVGPAVVTAAYVGKQVLTMFDGIASGNGFKVKLGFPVFGDLDSSNLLHGSIQLVVLVRLGEHRETDVDFEPEVQVFKPWSDPFDVRKANGPYDGDTSSVIPGVPTVTEPNEPGAGDPWAEWISLLGRSLIDDLPAVMSRAPSLAFVMGSARSPATTSGTDHP